jgi:hypothetical protein
LKKYRQIEVTAFRRRVTIVSGEWPSDISDAQPEQTDDGVSLNDTDSCEPVEPDSPEGQLILVATVRSLERRLSAESRAALSIPPKPNAACRSRFSRSFYAKLFWLRQHIIGPKSTHRTREEN